MKPSATRPPSGGAKKAAPASKGTAPKAHSQLPSIDEKDDYIMNLKGQVYLLTIENEMMKKSIVNEGPPGHAGGGGGGGGGYGGQLGASTTAAYMGTPRSAAPGARAGGAPTPALGTSSLNSPAASAALLAADLPAASYPTEISDAFEVMRQKYSQLEGRYQHDVDEARRAAEALASQCAAQSSLITTLKKEVEVANATLAEQKGVSQRVEQRSSADLEVAQRDIEALHERIREFQGIVVEKDGKVARLNGAISELKTGVVNANAAAAGAEAARVRALESYARQFIATRLLVRHWKMARLQTLQVTAQCSKVRACVCGRGRGRRVGRAGGTQAAAWVPPRLVRFDTACSCSPPSLPPSLPPPHPPPLFPPSPRSSRSSARR
jgi:hypothetical protein